MIIGGAAIAAAIPTLLNKGIGLIERMVPDKEAQRQATAELTFKVQDLHARVMMAQIEVNKVSASHPSLFVAGARPAAIWVGVISMLYAGVGVSILTAFGATPGEVDITALSATTLGLLGISHQRSQEKKAGKARENLNNVTEAKEPELDPAIIQGYAAEIATKYSTGDSPYDN